MWWVFVNHKGQRASSCVGSEKAAIRTKEDFEARLKLGLELFPDRVQTLAAPTFGKYYDKFERTYAKAACRESTIDRYEMDVRLHIKPMFADVPINEITRDKIKELIADLLDKGPAHNSIRNVMAVLRLVLNQAIEDGIIATNPATKLAKFYKRAKRARKFEFLTAEEVPMVLAAARDFDARRRKGDPEYFPVLLDAIHTGMRAGEISGLQWPDIDWNGHFLMVERSVKPGRVSPTKTGKVRRIDLSDALLDELRAYRRRLQEAALRQGKNELPVWVFASGEGTPLDMHNVERRVLPRCLEKAKLRTIRFHDLGHTFASLLIQNGESLAYVRDQLGHSSIKITVDLYGHLVPVANRADVNRLPSLGGDQTPETWEERSCGR